MYFWKISKKEYARTTTKTELHFEDTIEEMDSTSGLSLGPEMELFVYNFFLRGSYLQGMYGFDKGDAKREDIGFDGGLELVGETIRGGVFFGWRKMNVDFSGWRSTNIKEHNISDAVWGFIFRTTPNKSGLIGHLETAFGFKLTSSIGDDSDRYLEDDFVFESELNIGYRFDAIPLAINAGYGMWAYSKPTKKHEPEVTTIFEEIIEDVENFAHGPTLKISYVF